MYDNEFETKKNKTQTKDKINMFHHLPKMEKSNEENVTSRSIFSTFFQMYCDETLPSFVSTSQAKCFSSRKFWKIFKNKTLDVRLLDV